MEKMLFLSKEPLKKVLKYFFSILFCLFYRLLRVFPNNDPLMAFILPYSRKDSLWQTALFAFFSMAVFDLITSRLGVWTIITSLTYGMIAVIFTVYIKKIKKMSFLKYGALSAAGILAFDFVTGPIMSSFVFKISFETAFLGQIPFTILHLASGVTLAMFASQILDPDLRKNFLKNLSPQKLFLLEPSKAGFVLALILFCTAFFFSGCTSQVPEKNAAFSLEKNYSVEVKYLDSSGNLIFSSTIDSPQGKNFFELLKENIPLEYDSFEFGAFVKSINNRPIPEGYYLALYVDGNYAQKGISDYFVEKNSEITFKEEKISSFAQ